MIPAAALAAGVETSGLVTVGHVGRHAHEAAPAAEVAKWEIRKKLRKFHGP